MFQTSPPNTYPTYQPPPQPFFPNLNPTTDEEENGSHHSHGARYDGNFRRYEEGYEEEEVEAPRRQGYRPPRRGPEVREAHQGGRGSPPPPDNLRGGVPYFENHLPRNNARVQGVESHFRPMVEANASPIRPRRHGTSAIRPQYLSYLPHFHGNASEEPYGHLSEFSAICATVASDPHVNLEDVQLQLFQFTLKDMAKQWYLSLAPNSIGSWGEMQQVFLNEYYTNRRTTKARKAIRDFQQHSGESFYEAFKRFKGLLRNCPHHAMHTWELIKSFYDGLCSDDSRDLYSISGGTFLSNSEAVDWEYLERNAESSKIREQTDRDTKRPIVKAVDVEMKNRVEELEKKMSGLNKKNEKGIYQVSQELTICANCEEMGHPHQECPLVVGQEQVNQVQDQGSNSKQYDMNSNTYHPGLRNHRNFKYNNANNQSNPNFQSNVQGNGYQRPYNNQGGGYQRPYNNNNQGNYGHQRNFQPNYAQ